MAQTEIKSTLHAELVDTLGIPPLVYDNLYRHEDYLTGNWASYTMHGPRTVTISAEDLGIEGLHTIPDQSYPWMYVHTARHFRFLVDTDPEHQPEETLVMLKGYRIGSINPVEELREDEFSGTRGIRRVYTLNPMDETWTYEYWTENIRRNSVSGGKITHGRTIKTDLPENLWENVLELVKRPTKTVTERFATAILELHPELQIALVGLMESLAGELRGKFSVSYSGGRWSHNLEYDTAKLRKEIDQLRENTHI